MMATNSPCSTVSETWFSALVCTSSVRYTFSRFSVLIMGLSFIDQF